MITPRTYIDLNTIYPNEVLESENYKIKYTSLSKSDLMYELMYHSDNYWYVKGLKSDFNYVKLIKKSEGVMMSDTPMERNTNHNFLCRANGDVLIFGLGLGLIIFPLLNDDTIKSITVVELYQDLIDLVHPFIKKHDTKNKVKIIQGDMYSDKAFNDLKTFVFDTIYFDVWIDIDSEYYEEQKKLCRKYRKLLNKNSNKQDLFIDAWMKSHYKKQVAKDREEERFFESLFHTKKLKELTKVIENNPVII